MALLTSNYRVEFVEPLNGEESSIVCKKRYVKKLWPEYKVEIRPLS